MVQELGAPARVLLVADDPRAAMLIGELLRAAWSQGLIIAHAQRFADATRELLDHGATCVLLDLPRQDGEPIVALEHLRIAAPDVPIVVLAGQADEETGLAAVKAGAQDFLLKSELNPALLVRAVRYAIERKRSEVQLAHQALHDPLTALPNRALFIDRLSVALDRSRRTGRPVAVLFLDVDDFKQINDSMGHAAGDHLLTVLAERFRDMLRPMDTVARFGGDEFTFLFEELGSEREAVLIAERIRHAASLGTLVGDADSSIPVSIGSSIPVSIGSSIPVSIGIAIVSDPAVSPDQAIREADAAMYRAKEMGGARFEVFDETARSRSTQQFGLEGELRRALERSELRVHYQPRVSLNGQTGLLGFEALVRWEHPQRGLIAPLQFISIAEDTGLIVPIGQWVLEQALLGVGRWRQARPGVTISVNFSARQLQDPDLPARLRDTIASRGVDPSALCLEIAEDAVQRNPELASGMRALSQIGVKLAIDDFGKGRSSVASLRQLPVDTLMIDRSFVAGLGREPREAPIVGALVQLGHALGLSVLAEGVETEAQLAHLRELGCDSAQGFLFSPPVPEEGVHALLQSR